MNFFDLEFELDDRGSRVGFSVPDVQCSRPQWTDFEGRYCRLEPLDADRHAHELFVAYQGHDDLWTYMPQGPFTEAAEYRQWVESVQRREDPMFFAVLDVSTDQALGVASYLRIDTNARSIEVGWITYAPELQGSRAGTEAMYLMMRNAFELGFRRYEWKCNALNQASMAAAERLGMTFEGVFRKATIVKGRNRDTAWFAIVDDDWPAARAAMEAWLVPENFDSEGRQLTALSKSTNALVHRSWVNPLEPTR